MTTRIPLAAVNERFVTGSAQLTRASKRVLNVQPLFLLTDVDVDGVGWCDHLWITLDPYQRRQLMRGERFAFRAFVQPYQRRNGSRDYTLAMVRVMR